MKKINFENINELGFEYNYFEGYTYNHKKGFSISVYDVNTIFFKDKKFKCYTFEDFNNLLKELNNL